MRKNKSKAIIVIVIAIVIVMILFQAQETGFAVCRKYFGEYKLQPDYFYSDSKTGWSYGIKFEWGNKQTFITCIDINRVKVDTKVYKVKNGDSMENSLKDLFDELSEQLLKF